MNPFFMWLRGHPAERVALLVIALVLVGVIWQVAAHRGQSSGGPQAMASPSAAATATPFPMPSPGTTPAAADLDAAGAIARQFLIALNTYRYDDTPTSLSQRVRPYVTDQVYKGQFSQPSDTTYQHHPELHEVDSPQVTKLTPEGYTAAGSLGFLARVSVEVKTDQATTTAPEQAYELFVDRLRDGSWRVSSFSGSVPGAAG
jgi:hypothetical protein